MAKMKWLLLIGLAVAFVACSDDNNDNPTDSGPGDDGKVDKDTGPKPDGKVDPVECELDKDAAKVNIGGIFTLTKGGSADTQAKNKDQLDLIKAEVNAGCGTIGDKDKGAALEVFFKDGQDDKTLTGGQTKELIENDKCVAIVGAGGSAPSTPAAAESVKAGVPFGIYFGTGDSISGCSDAEMADDGVEKSPDPVFEEGKCWDNKDLVIRTATLSTVWGRTLAKYAKDKFATLKTAATVYRDDTFGGPIREQFEKVFVENGGTITKSTGYATGTTKEQFKDIIKELGDPEIIVGVWRIGELKSFMDAYAELGKDASFTKPSHYDTIQFINGGSVRSDYDDISADAIKAMAERSVGIQAYWNPDSEGFKKWLAAFKDFDPEAAVVAHTQMRTYDALMIMALAITKAGSTEGAKIAAEFMNVANPPGETIYPGEFAKARALLMDGKDINYEGASGSCDLADTGNVKTTPYQVWGVDADGLAELREAYDSAE